MLYWMFHHSGSELTPWYAQVSGTASSSIGSCRCAATTCSCDNGNSTASCDLRRRGEDSYMPNWRSRGVASVKDGWWVEAEYNPDMIIHDPIWSYSYRIFLDLNYRYFLVTQKAWDLRHLQLGLSNWTDFRDTMIEEIGQQGTVLKKCFVPFEAFRKSRKPSENL